MTLGDMADYRPEFDLQSFAQDKMREFSFRNFGDFEEVAVVQSFGEELGMPYCGAIQLALVSEMPEGVSALRLRRHRDGSWSVVAPRGADSLQWDKFLPSIPSEGSPVLWELPILEFTAAPLYRQEDRSESEE